MLTIAALCAGSLFAQQAVTESAAIKGAYNGIKGNLTKAAEAMPDDQYNFKASPDIRTFGALIAHIADAQGRTCAAVAGSTPPESAGSKTSKADLVAALKASYDICDGVINSLSDEDATKTVSLGRGGPRSKFAVLWGMIAHSNEEYGYLAVYMRLKGIVPPSSAGR
jgi:DinB superfamily